MTQLQNWLQKWLPANTYHTIILWYFAFTKIPMLFFTRPAVVEMSEERMVIKIALRRRTKNHLGSMYFGALCAGADCAAGLYAMNLIQKQPERISLIFKDMKAEFLRRAEGDVYFTCRQGRDVSDLVTAAAHSDERCEIPVYIEALVPGQGEDPVAKFILTLSLKKK
jgi:acyl-coenzyme A thioesterase PaaI-like protein